MRLDAPEDNFHHPASRSQSVFFSRLKIAHVFQHASIYHNERTFAATVRVCRALNASKMHLRPGLRSEPHWGSLKCSPDFLGCGDVTRCPPQEPTPPLSASSARVPMRQDRGYATVTRVHSTALLQQQT